MFKRSKGKHARERGAWAGWVGWVGPLFALEALLVTFSAKQEMDAAVASQLAEVARGGTL